MKARAVLVVIFLAVMAVLAVSCVAAFDTARERAAHRSLP